MGDYTHFTESNLFAFFQEFGLFCDSGVIVVNNEIADSNEFCSVEKPKKQDFSELNEFLELLS